MVPGLAGVPFHQMAMRGYQVQPAFFVEQGLTAKGSVAIVGGFDGDLEALDSRGGRDGENLHSFGTLYRESEGRHTGYIRCNLDGSPLCRVGWRSLDFKFWQGG